MVQSDEKDEDDNNIPLNEVLIQASNQYEAEEPQPQALNITAADSSKASGSASNVPSNAVSSSFLSSKPRPLLQLLPTSSFSNPTTSSYRCRFAKPKTDKEVCRERTLGVSKKTIEDTQYCFWLWEAWREHRNSTTATQIGLIAQMSNSKLQYWLTLFILEVSMQDSSVFLPASLHHFTAGLMRHFAEMKRLQQEGVRAKKRQAQVLTEANEELM